MPFYIRVPSLINPVQYTTQTEEPDIERICHHQQQRIIFDVGANIGQTGRYYHQKFPQADILCFEPIKETFTQ